MNRWQDSYTGTGLHYTRTGGAKPPLVLAHGFTDHGLCWTRTAQTLEEGYDIVMPDARGHGLSPNPSDPYTSELHAENLATLIEELSLGRPPVIGHSMGAMTAMFAAADHPENVGAVVLVDPPWLEVEESHSSDTMQGWRDHVAAQKAMSDSELLANIREENPGWHELETRAKAVAIRQFDIRTFEIFSLGRRDWRDVLPEIRCPSLLLWADAGIITEEIAGIAATVAPSLDAERIAHCGHSIQRDQFKKFTDVVQRFLTTLPGT